MTRVDPRASICRPQTVMTPPTDPGLGTGIPSLGPGRSAGGAAPNSRLPPTLRLAPRTGATSAFLDENQTPRAKPVPDLIGQG